jgi:hypothetical protein
LLKVGLGVAKRVAGKDKIRRRHGDRGDSGFSQRSCKEPSAKAFSKRREAIEKLGAGGRAALGRYFVKEVAAEKLQVVANPKNFLLFQT